MTRIFTGHVLAGRIHDDIREAIARLGRAPRCTVLIDESSAPMAAYAGRQREAAAKLGIELAFAGYERSPERVRDQLRRLGEDPRLDAAMTLYPLPAGIGPVEAAQLVGADRDVDGLHPQNAGLLALGAPARPPATARACRLAIEELAGSLRGAEIAVVGASPNDARPSHGVMGFLLGKGYRVIPVNPGQAGKEILGRTVYASLGDIPEPVDMVDVFRAPEALPSVVDEVLAMKTRPKAIWGQLSVRHDAAAAKAEAAGIDVVMDRCPAIEYPRLVA